MKALKIAGVVIALIAIILALPLVFGLPIGFLTTAIQDRVERDTGYRLTITGSATASLWPKLHVSVSDIKLEDPKDRDGNNRMVIGSVKADISLSSLWSGRPEITELTIDKPAFYLPLLRERLRDIPSRNRTTTKSDDDLPVLVDRFTVTNGVLVFSNPRDRVENRIEGIGLTAVVAADRKVRLTGSAQAGERPLKFDIKTEVPSLPIERQSIPAEFTIEIPGTLRAPLTGRAELRLNGRLIAINNLSGMLDDGAFNGWASVDVSSKPLVKLDLDFQRLDIPAGKVAAPTEHAQSWSTAPIDLRDLNYVDARVHLSAAELKVAGTRLGPAEIEASLAGGVLKATIGNVGIYSGQASGEFVVDASGSNPSYAMHGDLVGVRALPLMQNLVGFDRLDATLQTKLALRSSGASEQAIMSNLSGTAFLILQNGKIHGINVAQMIRSLTTNPLSGWQDSQELTTDLTQMSASFQIERGQATTADLNLVGPLVKVTGAGTIDLGNRALAMRVDPKLVLTTEGQGRTSDPIGLGIPIKVEGPWAQPRFYPDMAGILDDPNAAYAKLKQMGQGLFGKDGAGMNNLMSGIGGMIGNVMPNGVTGAPNGTTATVPAVPNAANAAPGGQSDILGGQLGSTIGNLLQQGLQQGLGNQPAPAAPPPRPNARNRNLAPSADAPQAVPAPSAVAPYTQDSAQESQEGQPDSQPMNEVMKRLFNR